MSQRTQKEINPRGRGQLQGKSLRQMWYFQAAPQTLSKPLHFLLSGQFTPSELLQSCLPAWLCPDLLRPSGVGVEIALPCEEFLAANVLIGLGTKGRGGQERGAGEVGLCGRRPQPSGRAPGTAPIQEGRVAGVPLAPARPGCFSVGSLGAASM